MKSNFIWVEGELVSEEHAPQDIFAPARSNHNMLFADITCIETAFGPAIFRLEDHLEQFLEATRSMGYPVYYSVEDLCDTVHRTLTFNRVRTGNIRPAVCWQTGTTAQSEPPVFAIATWEWPYSVARQPETAAHSISLNQGIPDNVALFVVQDGRIFTPPSTRFGNKVTRDSIITLARDLGYTVVEQPLTPPQVYQAGEVFISETITEIKAVREVDSHPIGEGAPGPVTQALQSALHDTLQGYGRRSQEWLDWVWCSFVGL